MSRTINSHDLTGRNPCINKAIHVLLIHDFAVLRISIPGLSQKLMSSSVTCTVANVISWREDDISLCHGSSVFKTFAGNMPFHAIVGTGKKNFSKDFFCDGCTCQSFRATKCFYAILAIKHAFLIHKHLLGPSGGVKPSPFRLGFQHLPWDPADVNA